MYSASQEELLNPESWREKISSQSFLFKYLGASSSDDNTDCLKRTARPTAYYAVEIFMKRRRIHTKN